MQISHPANFQYYYGFKRKNMFKVIKIPLFFVICWFFCSCSGPVSSVKTVGNEGKIKLEVEPDDALVYVDGNKIGKASQFTGDPRYLELSSGFHKFELKKEGYKTFSRKLFTGSAVQEIKVILVEE
jgi:hypothetical protein